MNKISNVEKFSTIAYNWCGYDKGSEHLKLGCYDAEMFNSLSDKTFKKVVTTVEYGTGTFITSVKRKKYVCEVDIVGSEIDINFIPYMEFKNMYPNELQEMLDNK